MMHHVTDVVRRVRIVTRMRVQEIGQGLAEVALTLQSKPAEGVVCIHMTLEYKQGISIVSLVKFKSNAFIM